jgi:nucleoid-associated protein YgaU
MRKDVKFGLTIGGILVVTLVIYVIVLSRGPAVPQKIGLTLPSQTDQSAAPKDVAKTDTDDQADANAPVTGDSTPATPSASTPSATDGQLSSVSPAPATQPATASNTPPSDWDSALSHGLPPALSAPQRTVTPTIDPSQAPLARAEVNRPPTVPMIDSLPTTQPTRTFTAEAPTIDSTPSPLYASAAPTAPAAVDPPTIDPSASPATPRTHRVTAGESPYSIAQAVYGNGRYYKQILAANPKIDPHRLRIGQILVIPELSSTDKGRNAVSSSASSPAAIDTSTQYVVARGDTLETISRKLYGGPAMIERLYEANKAVIGPDENVLKIGWVLKLPEQPTNSGGTGEPRAN